MAIAQIVEAEDSLAMTLPDEVLAHLNAALGDTLLLTETPEGFRLTKAVAAPSAADADQHA